MLFRARCHLYTASRYFDKHLNSFIDSTTRLKLDNELAAVQSNRM
ncbi:hypothetical protein NC99_42460 [Sunxiuqinia dokdonensis]|uniref:Uncharacterized protein n=1 Tax=Sunxiuqinia dokdonensis TaxID=1409788 RepID=A0A0L8V3F2_9BACT|nr:hypothetical protein NC99_42460 [Sunxiuqinia dokdonensis]